MKILYAIQGTGNGHIARAEEIVPLLFEHGKVDLFISGSQADINLPYPVKYRSKGLSFYFGKNGGIDFIRTFRHNSSKRVINEIKALPVEDYDLVLNDFEAISAWACKKKKVPCIALSHQFAMLSPKVPTPKKTDPVGEWFLKNYAPCPAGVGFHFERYEPRIFTPVIRERIRNLRTGDKGHFLVYLPAFGDERLLRFLSHFRGVKWVVFSKHCTASYKVNDIVIHPVNNDHFTKILAGARGVLCGAGFETPAEVLHLGKRLMVIPMKNQYEQHLNAAALKQLGVPVIKKLNENGLEIVSDWLESDRITSVSFCSSARPAIEQAMSLLPKVISHLG